MKLVNVSSRVVAIGTTVLLPDKETTVKEMTPGIEALVEAGFIKTDDSDEKAAKAAAKEAAEQKIAEEKAKAEAKAKADAEKAAKAAEKAKANK